MTVFGLSEGLIASNLIGLLVYPVTWWQFRSTNKRHFLWANFLSCVLFAAALWPVDQHTAAMVSLIAGVSSLFQSFIHRRPVVQLLISVASIALVFWLTPPTELVGWLSLVAYAWVRIAETQDDHLMRLMIFVSPFAWLLINVLSSAYTLIPLEIMVIYLSMQWLMTQMKPGAIEGGPQPSSP